MRKHALPLLLAVWPYLFFLFVLLPDVEAMMNAFFLGYCALTAAVYLANILFTFRTKGMEAKELARWDFIIKLAHIPFYVLVFLFGALLALAIAAPAVLMMAMMILPTLMAVDVLLMLTSSCYGFAALHRAKREGLTDRKWTRLHTIMHCFFVTDVISAFLIWRRLKKEN